MNWCRIHERDQRSSYEADSNDVAQHGVLLSVWMQQPSLEGHFMIYKGRRYAIRAQRI